MLAGLNLDEPNGVSEVTKISTKESGDIFSFIGGVRKDERAKPGMNLEERELYKLFGQEDLQLCVKGHRIPRTRSARGRWSSGPSPG